MAHPHKPFLEQIARHYLELFSDKPCKAQFVFPSRRAILFFNHYLGQMAERPIFAPECMTVNEFILSLQHTTELAEESELLFLLYQSYAEARALDDIESFEEFLYWGRIILSDFDTIDRYLAPVNGLLTNLSDYRELEDDYSYLTEESKNLILDYWKNLGPKHSGGDDKQGSLRERFLAFYRSLLPTYRLFTDRLRELSIGYEGMIYKQVAQDIDRITDQLEQEDKYIIFVGLFDISHSEEKIFRALYKRQRAEFCWDEQVHPLHIQTEQGDSTAHPTRLMYERIRRHLGQVQGAWCDPYTERAYLPKRVTAVSTTSIVGQVKALPQILERLEFSQERSSEVNDIDTAIILANDGLLFPTVGSIPDQYKSLNITLGYPLDRTPIAVFIASWANLINATTSGRYTSDRVLDLLSNQLLCQHYPVLERLIDSIHQHGIFYLSYEWLHQQYGELIQEQPTAERERLDICQILFSPHRVGGEFLRLLDSLLDDIITHSQIDGQQEDEDLDEGEQEDELEVEAKVNLSFFDAEFILHYRSLIERLLGLLRVYGQETIGTSTVLKLLEGLSAGITIPFQGNPLRGLQVMGLLESRLLHFSKLIYIGATDGDLPSSQSKVSLIPHELRRGYQLPQRSDMQAAATYRFYQSIANAEHLIVLYSGTISRYIMQLEYLYGVPIERLTAEAKPEGQTSQPICIDKREEAIYTELEKYYRQDAEARALSPTAIATYLYCPLRFCYQTIYGVREESEPEQLLTDNKFGDVFHEVMCLLYRAYEDGQVIPKGLFEHYRKQRAELLPLVRGAYIALNSRKKKPIEPRSTPLKGLAEMNCQLIAQYVSSQLHYDEQTPDLRYIRGELKVNNGYITTPKGLKINLKGTIDRIDSIAHADATTPYIRILDYKTGKDKKKDIRSAAQMLEHVSDYKAIIQTFIYCELLLSDGGKYAHYRAEDLHPGLLLMRGLSESEDDYEVGYTLNKAPLNSYAEVREEFLEALGTKLDEIFDLNIPFKQCQGTDYCKTCPFKLSCGR